MQSELLYRKRFNRRQLWLFCLLTLAAFVWSLFLPESFALFWHLRHGAEVNASDLRFKTTWASQVLIRPEGFGVSDIPGKARASRGYYSVFVNYRPNRPPIPPKVRSQTIGPVKGIHPGLIPTSQARTVDVAGLKLTCTELKGIVIGTAYYGDVSLDCYGVDSDIQIEFVGKPSRLPEFEEFLASAKMVKK